MPSIINFTVDYPPPPPAPIMHTSQATIMVAGFVSATESVAVFASNPAAGTGWIPATLTPLAGVPGAYNFSVTVPLPIPEYNPVDVKAETTSGTFEMQEVTRDVFREMLSAPTGLHSEYDKVNNRFKITWDAPDPSAGITKYRIYYGNVSPESFNGVGLMMGGTSFACGGEIDVANVGNPPEIYLDEPVNNVPYWIGVSAVSGTDESAKSVLDYNVTPNLQPSEILSRLTTKEKPVINIDKTTREITITFGQKVLIDVSISNITSSSFDVNWGTLPDNLLPFEGASVFQYQVYVNGTFARGEHPTGPYSCTIDWYHAPNGTNPPLVPGATYVVTVVVDIAPQSAGIKFIQPNVMVTTLAE